MFVIIMIKYIFCILIGIFFVYGVGYIVFIEEIVEFFVEVIVIFVL